jgi:hypothetical protein
MSNPRVLLWRLQVESFFTDDVWNEYDYYLNNELKYFVEYNYLGSGFDIMTFGTKAERTKVVRRLKKIGVPDNCINLTKEIKG